MSPLSSDANQPVPLLVAGAPVTSERALAVRNPYNDELIASVCQADAPHLQRASQAAAEAFGETSCLASWKRSQMLNRIADGLGAETEEFARGIAQEAGKPIRDARLEVGRAIQTFRVAAEEARRIGGDILPLDWTAGSDGRVALLRRFAIGPVLGITPFNFPLNLVAHKVAPALACGSPIVLKPAPATPLTSLRLAQVLLKAGWPAGAISVLPCSNELTAQLVADERYRSLSFTGSAKVGWELKAAAGKKHVTLELGGNAAVILHSDSNADVAIPKVAKGAFTYSGQSCISVQRIFAHRSVFELVSDRLVAAAEALRCGDPLDEATDLGPLISEDAAVRVETWVKDAVSAGARLLTGGERTGALLRPTILTGVPETHPLHQEEAFGPVAIVELYDDFHDALRRVNSSRYGLQAGLFTSQWPLISQAFRTLETGALLIDEVPTWRAEHMPYGGVKDSGMGREGICSAIEAMTEPRLLVLNL